MPAFVFRTAWLAPDELPDAYSSQDAGIRAKGSHGDPTYATTVERLLGPRRSAFRLPHHERVPRLLIADLLAHGLGTLEHEAIDLVLCRGKGSVGAGFALKVARSTVDERILRGVEALCACFYGDRWG